jgi:hypothetical protein
MAKERTATIIKTGEKVKVYKHRLSEDWVRSDDCETSYSKEELKF